MFRSSIYLLAAIFLRNALTVVKARENAEGKFVCVLKNTWETQAFHGRDDTTGHFTLFTLR